MKRIRRWLLRFAYAIISRFGIYGRVRLVFRDSLTGSVSHVEEHNTFINNGRNKIRDYLAGDAPGYPTHCAVSDDATAITVTSTGIGSEHVRAAVTQRIKSAQSLQINTFFNTSQASGQYIQKVGLADAVSGGTFFAIAAVSRRQKDVNETLTVEWTFDLSA